MLHEAALLAAPQPTAPATAHRPGHISDRCFSDAGLPREERLGRSGCHPYVRALVPPYARAKDACRSAATPQAERAVSLRLDSAREQAATLQEVLRAQRDELGEQRRKYKRR